MARAQLAEIAPLVLAADRRYAAAQAARDEAVATAEAELESARNELQRVDAQRRDASERVQWLTARGVVA